MTDVTPAPAIQYKDDDLVYVDPHLKIVVGLVEFTETGKSKPLAMKTEEPVELGTDDDTKKDPKGRRPVRRQRYYPWGTYRSMKRIYKLEGKITKQESPYTLDQVMEKALKEPFWD